MSSALPMTPAGLEKLRQELQRLSRVDRIEAMETLENAVTSGGTDDNSDMEHAKTVLDALERRIADLQDKIARAQVIDPATCSGDRVVFGARVTLLDTDTDGESRYQLVGEDEADVKSGTLSVTSPLGRALIGREVGDVIDVRTPAGPRCFELIDLRYE